MKYTAYVSTSFGSLLIEETDGAISAMHLFAEDQPPEDVLLDQPPATELIRQATQQMREYFLGQRMTFSLPLDPQGTPFQKKVWRALQDIPYGTTATYKDIAQAVDCPKGFRAIGMANHNNPIPFVIPCHRVLGSDGKLVGFGMGLPLKQKLLDMERDVLLRTTAD